MISRAELRRIPPDFRAKIWGSPRLAPWFADASPDPSSAAPEPSSASIGEVWFPSGDLLVKFLFTSANLSVQVHPDDSYARKHGEPRGKTEMWHILRADPGARIALGFKRPIAPEQLIPAAESGEIMHLLNWIEVQPGETYFVPAGTVHAIGAGLALVEIQQLSDLTYRLFDYGRGRELHLQQALEVTHPGVHPGVSRPDAPREGLQLLVDCPYFTTYRAFVRQPVKLASDLKTRILVILEGVGKVNGMTAAPGLVFEATEPRGWRIEPDQPAGSGSMTILLIA